MSARRGFTLRSRLAAILGVAVFLVLAGTGVATAAWTASSAVNATSTATSATVSLTVPAALTASYTSTTTTPVIAALSLANTGGAPLGLAVTATNTNADLSGQTSLKLWLQTGGSCGTTVPGTGVTSGTLAAPPALPAGATSATAGTTVVVCAATLFTGTFANYVGQTTTVTLTLTGSVGTQWRPTATASFTQTVVQSGFSSNEANRYKIYNQNVCIGSNWDPFNQLARNQNCGSDQTSQFRLLDGPNGTKYIQRAYNVGTAPTNRWNASSATAVNMVTGAAVTAQQWTITPRPDGVTYQFVNAAQNTKCLQVQADNSLTFATCNAALASQGFTFEIVGNAAPAPVTLTCSGNGSNYIQYSWPVLAGYQEEVDYRIYVAGVYIYTNTDGYFPSAQLYNNQAPNVAIPAVGTGSKTVEVYQSVAGSAWSLTGSAILNIAPGSNNLTCG